MEHTNIKKPIRTPDIHAIVNAAIHAPSGGNSQPWRWVSDGSSSLWLIHDYARSESLFDYQSRATLLSLGAAIENAVLAAHKQNLRVKLNTFPNHNLSLDAKKERVVALLTLTTETNDDDNKDQTFDNLFDNLYTRHTNRKMGQRKPLDSNMIKSLTAAIESIPGNSLTLIHDTTDLAKAGELLSVCDKVRLTNRHLREQLIKEVRWSDKETAQTKDGLDIKTLELSFADKVGLKMIRHGWLIDLLKNTKAFDKTSEYSKNLAKHSSTIGLIKIDKLDDESLLMAGRAMQRLWLTADKHDLMLVPLSILPFMLARIHNEEDSRFLAEDEKKALLSIEKDYQQLFDIAQGQIDVFLFRLASAKRATTRSLRLPIEQVLSFI